MVDVADLTERARAGDERAFRELVEPYRRELHLHCYRILGSFHDAEDALQETLLTAWRSLPSFEGRSSIRTWLYRVATTRSLNMRRSKSHTSSSMDNQVELPKPSRMGEVLWLEPYPDALLETVVDSDPGPEAHYEAREAISLAFITALQLLPPRQRAAQILREVLGFRASEVAEMLDSTEESVTSALKRARATLQLRVPPSGEGEAPPPPRSATERAVVERFTRAFQADDVEELIALLTEQVWINMPPLPFEWQGHAAAREVLRVVLAPGRHLLSTRANGQPAFGLYLPAPSTGQLQAVGMLVLTLAGDRVSTITRFDAGVLPSFNLPAYA